uniref:SAND domain-containing protein n=1 Tax=Hucho hucho TaxID=62062 RepID=A0A4W5MGF8_9TELE
MDPLDILTDEQLLRFSRRSTTEMLCMEQPHIFLNQVRDHHLIPEEMYKGVYKVLDWLETERPHSIKLFWSCVFRDHLLQQYPTLHWLRNSLLDGSFKFNAKLPENLEKEEKEKEEKERKVPGQGEEKKKGEEEKNTGQKKRKQKISESAKEEQPSMSTQSTPSQKRMVQRPTYVSCQKSTRKSQRWVIPVELPVELLPVTCGDKEGMLNRDKLAKGESCILVQGRWLTPSCFEEFGGKKSSKNWKYSVRCRDTTLGKLIQEGHLTSPRFYRRKSAQAKKAPFPSNQSANSITDSKPEEDDDAFEDEEEEAEQERQNMQRGEQANTAGGESSAGGSHGVVEKSVFKVTCGAINGTLHKDRFASGLCGKSIRTEMRWMTPVEFVKGWSALADPSWKKDIRWDGKPLSVLIKVHRERKPRAREKERERKKKTKRERK